MSQALIRQAFETRLKAWADAQTPAIPVAWENRPFDPPAGRYIRAFMLVARTESETLAREHRRRTGIFQANLYLPLGTGAGSAETLSASLDAYFAQSVTQGSIRVFLTAPFSAAPAIQVEDRYMVPISAQFRADTV